MMVVIIFKLHFYNRKTIEKFSMILTHQSP